MTGETNGNASINGGQQQAAPAPPGNREEFEHAMQAMMAHATTVMTCSVRGLVVTMPNLPPAAILIGACRALGVLIGSSYTGKLEDILARRRDCRDAFMQGMTQFDLKDSSPPKEPTNDTAIPPGN